MSENLFKDFDPISEKAWKQKIHADLKGADYNETLVTSTDEGINIKPFYHQDSHHPLALPQTKNWEITEKIYLENYDSVKQIITDVLDRGAESLWLILPKSNDKLFDLLDLINTKQVPVFIEALTLDLDFLKKLDQKITSLSIPVKLSCDPLHHLAQTGNWMSDKETDIKAFSKMIALPQLNHQVSIDTRLYQNAGATLTEELAISLSHLNEYLNVIQNADKKIKKLHLTLIVSVGSNYFFEIAKLKAYRILIESLMAAYDFSIQTHIIAEPSKRNKSLYDYNVNMLRTTTECMSAVLGGANWINNLAFDEIFHKTNEFGERISRNQLLILKNESYFDKVSNPTDGSYYIETLTQQLSENALDLFKKIEKNEGFIDQLFKGQLQKMIKASSDLEISKLENQDFVMVGTNKYENKEDRMAHELELYPFLKKKSRKTLLEPILETRIASKIEQERLAKEKSNL
ncbi:MAG: methylmalonyl-CoA mutase subunit beta [Psychroflexus sp.]|nr:methylmalonyl-CoA mutase subunit beta [Psychroflexus sp.]MDN6309436.1 methylmalonyl-CoA mutase subunit beta [Psychroflexus sp.]